MVRGLVSGDRTNRQEAGLLRIVTSLSSLVSYVTFAFVLTFASFADVAKGGDGAKSALREIFFVSSGVTQASQLAMPVQG
jgi:hypothetical protein